MMETIDQSLREQLKDIASPRLKKNPLLALKATDFDTLGGRTMFEIVKSDNQELKCRSLSGPTSGREYAFSKDLVAQRLSKKPMLNDRDVILLEGCHVIDGSTISRFSTLFPVMSAQSDIDYQHEEVSQATILRMKIDGNSKAFVKSLLIKDDALAVDADHLAQLLTTALEKTGAAAVMGHDPEKMHYLGANVEIRDSEGNLVDNPSAEAIRAKVADIILAFSLSGGMGGAILSVVPVKFHEVAAKASSGLAAHSSASRAEYAAEAARQGRGGKASFQETQLPRGAVDASVFATPTYRSRLLNELRSRKQSGSKGFDDEATAAQKGMRYLSNKVTYVDPGATDKYYEDEFALIENGMKPRIKTGWAEGVMVTGKKNGLAMPHVSKNGETDRGMDGVVAFAAISPALPYPGVLGCAALNEAYRAEMKEPMDALIADGEAKHDLWYKGQPSLR